MVAEIGGWWQAYTFSLHPVSQTTHVTMSPNVAYIVTHHFMCFTCFLALFHWIHTVQLERCKNDLRGNEKWATIILQQQDRPFFHLDLLGIWLMVSARVTYKEWASSALKDTRWAKTHLINGTSVSVKSQTKCFLFDSIGKCCKCKFVNALLGNWIVVLSFSQTAALSYQTKYNEPLTWTATTARCSQLHREEGWYKLVNCPSIITGAVREMMGHMFDTAESIIFHTSCQSVLDGSARSLHRSPWIQACSFSVQMEGLLVSAEESASLKYGVKHDYDDVVKWYTASFIHSRFTGWS